ncbi:DUF3606 domain-containing protein [Variovorax arabinosiphilus]|uniref:DUF3606 domain-containing protein n=1 Tax=Variovorax arabinosiphilus TaxID=3053498 RepID=UPI0025755309|nr:MULTISPECIES: DUF3606 domain-containing protein [unclassified Variovorax]MDM0121685.1 DUF3606 domain-containing protein [Variovorax sp. J2L1-78]MDM0130746.1 DUF3606 domain-containing protein [Variovorax sp. J2L1-63]MDM0234448.1 DUF3606 domain-containing protein [Variovorax sp. J2R1-6]
MTDNDRRHAPNGTEPDRIDLVSDASLAEWARKLAVTEDQLKEAVSRVGDRATDVEMHLKGSRSTTNKERVKEVGSA